MYTISDVIADINRGCTANNMVEDKFLYRIVFFVNEGNKGTKHYTDASYGGLRNTLEGIVRNYLSLTNSVVIAEITALKDGKCVRLQSKAYAFSLDRYFEQISGKQREGNRNLTYTRYAVR